MATTRGGDKLGAALREMAAKLSKAKTVKIGFLEGSTYPDGTSVPMVAAIQNFGAPRAKIPPRPFFTSMIQQKSPGWGKAIAVNLKANDYDAKLTLENVGVGIGDQLRDSIIETNEPALSPITVMLRGMKSHDQSLVVTGKTVGEAAARVRDGKTNYGASTKVLDDTGHLLNSVDHEVKS